MQYLQPVQGMVGRLSSTGCKYCITNCPQNINTPGIIGLLNEYNKYQALQANKRSYGMMTGMGGKASSCVECRSCEDHCPQNIKIIDILKKAADLFE